MKYVNYVNNMRSGLLTADKRRRRAFRERINRRELGCSTGILAAATAAGRTPVPMFNRARNRYSYFAGVLTMTADLT